MSISYDSAAANESQSVSLRGLDLKDYPPDRPGRITGVFNDRPLIAGVTSAASSAGAGAAVDLAFDKIEAHFSQAPARALAQVNAGFPPVAKVLADFKLAERGKAYDDVMAGRAKTTKTGRLDANLSDLSEYQDALVDAVEHLNRRQGEADPILEGT